MLMFFILILKWFRELRATAPQKYYTFRTSSGTADVLYVLFKSLTALGPQAFFLEKKKFDKIAFLDADLSTSLEECYALSKKVNSKIKFVFGSRIRKIDNNINRLYHRFIIGRILATFISRILNLPVYDSQCGCKIFNSELIPVAFNDHFLTKWLFDVEIFFRLKNHFGSENLIAFSKETPLKSWKDMGGSKIRLSYGFWVWFDLIKIYRFYK